MEKFKEGQKVLITNNIGDKDYNVFVNKIGTIIGIEYNNDPIGYYVTVPGVYLNEEDEEDDFSDSLWLESELSDIRILKLDRILKS